MNEHIEFLEPWVAIGKYAENLVKELQREVVRAHPLLGTKLRAIAQRTDSDDVLFQLLNRVPQFAVVHLTWSGKAESDARWPDTRFFASFEEWISEGMQSDHREFIGGDA